ncbi:hypothetical protein CKO51_20050 [Rhodopirellula sp. SM50]|nr:hypothetical protein CKO51_20050 [Rhodopirellula sp. SM50]
MTRSVRPQQLALYCLKTKPKTKTKPSIRSTRRRSFGRRPAGKRHHRHCGLLNRPNGSRTSPTSIGWSCSMGPTIGTAQIVAHRGGTPRFSISGTRMAVQTRRLAAERLESRRLLATVSVTQSFDESARELRLPLRVENAHDIRAAEIRIEYDPTVVRAEAWTVEPGEFWNGRVSMSVNIDQDAGTITAFLFTAEPVEASGGDLISIGFQEEACVSQPGSAAITVSHVHFDERAAALSVTTPVTAPVDRQPVPQPLSELAGPASRRVHHTIDPPMGPLRPDRVDVLMSGW